MSKARKTTKSTTESTLRCINPNAAGVDIGAETHWVAAPEDRDERPVRSFGCFTADLLALAKRLKKCRIKTVARC